MLAHAFLALALALAGAGSDVTAAYRVAGSVVYVGIDGEPPGRPTIQYYDSKSQRMGTLQHVTGNRYRSSDAPVKTFNFTSPSVIVQERRFIVGGGQDQIGFSLWYAQNAVHRPTIVLIQGADDSTRQMGFLVPFFVVHGLSVLTYDQRGTGQSAGNWRYAGPVAKAHDILAILNAAKTDSAVDPQRIGAWAASNGGWVAPIVANRFPLAFLILKSTPSSTIEENVLYEIEQDLRERGQFSPQQISQALAFERVMFSALQSNTNWNLAGQALAAARTQPWFSHMRIPPGMATPPPPAMLAAMQDFADLRSNGHAYAASRSDARGVRRSGQGGGRSEQRRKTACSIQPVRSTGPHDRDVSTCGPFARCISNRL